MDQAASSQRTGEQSTRGFSRTFCAHLPVYHRSSYTSPTVWLAQTRDKQIPASIPTISKNQVCQIGWHRDFEEICETCALRK